MSVEKVHRQSMLITSVQSQLLQFGLHTAVFSNYFCVYWYRSCTSWIEPNLELDARRQSILRHQHTNVNMLYYKNRILECIKFCFLFSTVALH